MQAIPHRGSRRHRRHKAQGGRHIAENACVFDTALDAEDEAALAPIPTKGRDLMLAIGDCGDEYR